MPTIMPLWADRPLLAALASISSPARSALEESVGGLRKIGQTEAVSFSSGVHTVYTPSYRLLYKGPPQWPLEAETGYPLTDGGIDAELSVRDIVVVYTRQ